MPHARVDMLEKHRPKMAEISAAILKGMVTGLNMPEDDLFQIFRLHQPGELVFIRARLTATTSSSSRSCRPRSIRPSR